MSHSPSMLHCLTIKYKYSASFFLFWKLLPIFSLDPREPAFFRGRPEWSAQILVRKKFWECCFCDFDESAGNFTKNTRCRCATKKPILGQEKCFVVRLRQKCECWSMAATTSAIFGKEILVFSKFSLVVVLLDSGKDQSKICQPYFRSPLGITPIGWVIIFLPQNFG